MEELLFGGTLLAALLGGLVALLAPCCVSVMLPAYLASGFRHKSGILLATVVFALGVATIIVPIGLGATAVAALLSGQHAIVFTVAATAMLLGGVGMLLGWKPRLPMLTRSAPTGRGLGSVYGLGVFSGAASACCAPVLAGVAVLSGATASFPAALAVGSTYVVGMVAPLAVLALVWDRKNWGSKLLQRRQVTMGFGRLRRTMSFGTAASAFLLIAMAALTYVQAAFGPGSASDAWLVRLAADLEHVASLVSKALAWVPGWVVGVALLAGVGYFVWRAIRRSDRDVPAGPESVGPDNVDAGPGDECCATDAAAPAVTQGTAAAHAEEPQP